MFAFHRRYQGQSMAEFCIAAPVLVLLLWSILYLADMYIVKHKTLVAARYGTWLLSRYDNVPENRIDFNQVEDRIKRKFFGKRPQENVFVDPQHTGTDLKDIEFFRNKSGVFFEWVLGFLAENLLKTDTPAIYSLKVKYKYPRAFGAVDLREGNHNFFEIQSEHFVLGNSWDGQRTEVHDLVEMIEERAGDIIEEALDNLKF